MVRREEHARRAHSLYDRRVMPPEPPAGEIARLVEIMARLRAPDGCPWDREQTLETLFPYLREELDEAAEAALAAERGEKDPGEVREELGDLLFNVVFVVQLCREKGWFDMAAVIRGAAEKITRRHPHVFGDESAETAADVEEIWQRVKREERGEA